MNYLADNQNKVVVFGNGPSLKRFDFSSLSNFDSIGMNAAYRFWERINWYPTHYVCLDDQLIETHADAIYALIREKKVKTAFLIAKILDYHPSLLNFKNVFYLESFHTARQKRVSSKGVPYINSIFFKESDSSKVTTGAYSVRYAAHLGYKNISILGVDLRYVEMIPEAARQDGVKLVMTETPKSNPNYFFDDYQRAGDKYNIPNPASHDRNLHIAAFEVLANDSIQFGWNVKILNSNKKSVLYDKAILPFIDIKQFINQRKLSAIVVPTTPREIDQLERNLKLWDWPLLSPSFYPDLDAKPDLIFAFSSVEDSDLSRRVLEAVENTAYVRRCFDKIEVLDVELDKSLDYYEKDYRKKVQGRGYKSGPNEQFFELISRLSHYEGFVFYMETDCVPLRQGWLDAIRELAEGDSESWVIGAYYRGIDRISERFAFHLNGNALYRVGDPEFIAFVEQFWRPKLYEILDSVDQRLAYDCLLSYLFTAAKPGESNQEWKTLQAVGHRFRATSLIQNISGAADQQQNVSDLVRGLLTRTPTTVVAHGAPFQKFANQMLTDLGNDQTRPCYWGGMIGEVPPTQFAYEYDWPIVEQARTLRLLMIDSTPIGHNSATGQLKQTFLENWPTEQFLQIWETGGAQSSPRVIQLGQSIDESRANPIPLDQIVERCQAFQPDVIYFRPVDSEVLFDVVESTVAVIHKPLVIHIMDDWPERLRINDAAKYQRLDHRLRHLLSRASRRLSISQAMAEAYRDRYGGDWSPLANGVDIAECPAKDWSRRPPVSAAAPFVIRYMGALADDMTYASVREIAAAVASQQASCHLRMEIYTMDWCRSMAEKDFGKQPGIAVFPLVAPEQYRACLAEADALVIAYNFDPKSIAYIGLSLANKMPECLASGVPLLAYGPEAVATIRHLKTAGCAQVIDQRDPKRLIAAIQSLVNDSSLCQEIGQRGRKHAAEHLSKQQVQARFRAALSGIEAPKNGVVASVIGPYSRTQQAHYDETDCIAQLFQTTLSGQCMIDVGAHHGWAHAPFLDRGWRIFAFEPDNKNRAKLLERLAKHKHKDRLSLDTRCVSNQSQQGISFFTSEQSTGISGLSAFHDTHVESQKVDTTTLTDFFADKPLPPVDFLKIDTEGHDLFVLQGFPWGRGQPAVIECEFEDTKTVPLGYTFHDLARFLVERGYTVYVSEWHPIIRYGIRHDWRQLLGYPCELADPKGWGNLLAFRDPIDEAALVAAVKKVLTLGTGKAPAPPVKSTPSLPAPRPGTAWTMSGQCPGFQLEPGTFFVPIALNQWRFTDAEAKQKLWIASQALGPTTGRTFTGTLRLQADRAVNVHVSLGRHGRSDYEGTTQRLDLIPGVAKQVTLNKAFQKQHEVLKLQIDVVDLPGGGSTVFTIDQLGLGESIASLRKRLGPDALSLSHANRLFREGDLAAALAIFVWLSQQRSLPMYGDNALRTAKALGMSWATDVKELAWVVG